MGWSSQCPAKSYGSTITTTLPSGSSAYCRHIGLLEKNFRWNSLHGYCWEVLVANHYLGKHFKRA
jgi:hypothetical protein